DFGPNVSVRVEGNSEKISPQPKNTRPVSTTNSAGRSMKANRIRIATASSENATNIVISRPIWSETQPKNGRVNPFVTRDSVNDSGNAAMPSTITCATPNSRANGPTFDVTIRPDVDIMLIMRKSSQNTGFFSISCGV